MQRKPCFTNDFVNWIKGSVIKDFSTEHNWTSIYRIFFVFYFLEQLEDSCFKIICLFPVTSPPYYSVHVYTKEMVFMCIECIHEGVKGYVERNTRLQIFILNCKNGNKQKKTGEKQQQENPHEWGLWEARRSSKTESGVKKTNKKTPAQS